MGQSMSSFFQTNSGDVGNSNSSVREESVDKIDTTSGKYADVARHQLTLQDLFNANHKDNTTKQPKQNPVAPVPTSPSQSTAVRKPRQRQQQQQHPRQFVPRLKSTSPVRKSKLKLLQEKQQRKALTLQEQNHHHHHQNHPHDNNHHHEFLKQQQHQEQRESELIEAEMKRIGVQRHSRLLDNTVPEQRKQQQEAQQPVITPSQVFESMLKSSTSAAESANAYESKRRRSSTEATESSKAYESKRPPRTASQQMFAETEQQKSTGSKTPSIPSAQSKGTSSSSSPPPPRIRDKVTSTTTTRKKPSPPKKAAASTVAWKKRPVAKLRPPQQQQEQEKEKQQKQQQQKQQPQRQKSPSQSVPGAARKPPPAGASQTSTGASQQEGSTLASSPFHAASPVTAQSDLDIAASVLMQLTLGSTTERIVTQPTAAAAAPTHEIYPVDTRTKKYFTEFRGWFQGRIRSYNQDTRFYSVEYEDGDTEDLEHHEIDTGSLPPNKYEIGMKYEKFLTSKKTGKGVGWFVGTIQSKFFHDPKHKKGARCGRGVWQYRVVYSDGDSEDVDEAYITEAIEEARQKRGRKRVELPSKDGKVKKSPSKDAKVKIKEIPVNVPTRSPEPSVVDMEVSPPEDDESSSSSSSPEGEESSSEDDESSSGDESSSSSSSSEEEDDDEDDDPNAIKAPHWSGKQHHQFITGLREYGLGNLEDIHKAGCIPSRSFGELVRYWEFYVADLQQKGFAHILDFDKRGTKNGKKGTRFGLVGFGNDNDGGGGEDEKKAEDTTEDTVGFHMGKWTSEEQEMVSKAYAFAGNSYQAMSDFMKIRSAKQISSYFNRHKKQVIERSRKYAEEAAIAKAERGGDNSDVDIAAENNNGDDVDGSCKPKAWTFAEHDLLAEAMAIYGRNPTEIAAYMKSRTKSQIAGYTKRNPKSLAEETDAKKRLFKKKFAKKTGAWNSSERARLLEGHAIFEKDFERIADYVKTRNATQVESVLESNASQYQEDSHFDLTAHFSFPIELFHVLNVAPFEGFDHIISWNEYGDSVLINDNHQFAKVVFPRYSYLFKGIGVQKFYDNLKLFGFQEIQDVGAKPNTGAFHHPAFKRGHYRSVEKHTRDVFRKE